MKRTPRAHGAPGSGSHRDGTRRWRERRRSASASPGRRARRTRRDAGAGQPSRRASSEARRRAAAEQLPTAMPALVTRAGVVEVERCGDHGDRDDEIAAPAKLAKDRSGAARCAAERAGRRQAHRRGAPCGGCQARIRQDRRGARRARCSSSTSAPRASNAGMPSAAGDALQTLPATVPVFWICTPPTSRAAAFRASNQRRQLGANDIGPCRRGADRPAARRRADAAQAGDARQIKHRALQRHADVRRIEVGAAGQHGPVAGRQQLRGFGRPTRGARNGGSRHMLPANEVFTSLRSQSSMPRRLCLDHARIENTAPRPPARRRAHPGAHPTRGAHRIHAPRLQRRACRAHLARGAIQRPNALLLLREQGKALPRRARRRVYRARRSRERARARHEPSGRGARTS